jgi:hypothetical protein
MGTDMGTDGDEDLVLSCKLERPAATSSKSS